MFKKPLFWIALVIVSLLSVAFTVKFFSRAFPIVNIDLKMNRAAALKAARSMAAQNGWGPAGYKQVATFDVDQDVQNFVELEGGGKDAFVRMIKDGLYAPYSWTVRNFREGELVETYIDFTPEGTPYGFSEKLPEKQPGRNLPSKTARKIAEASAAQWGVRFADYDLVEESEELKVGGRRDHTYIYERNNAKVGAGTYRLRLTVGGDRLTELSRFVKIPESFSRRFQEMRSANNTIASVTDIVAGVSYVFGGCIIGLFLLLRKGRVLWKVPLLVAFIIAGLQVLSDVNSWPMEWMGYDTALSYSGFVLDHIMSLIYKVILDFALLSLSFMAAESLSRKAFPGHIQLLKLWSKDAAPSVQVLGRTVSGYLLVSLFCAYQVMLYYITAKFPGWWTPSDTLLEPNIFSAYFPWFSSFATAIHAGFWEESLFRAVPIACGAIIGERFGNRRKGIFTALIVQALVFGAAHANYPNMPSYARLVELIVPSLGFGLLYIYFGLLPGILLHFSFDAVWLSLPMFIASAHGVWFDRVLIVLSVLLPLWIVLFRRLQTGRWIELPAFLRNSAWKVPESPAIDVEPEDAAPGIIMPRRTIITLLVCGLAGLLLWIAAGRFRSDVPALREQKDTAITQAKDALTKQGVELQRPWQPLTIISAEADYADRFVWQKGRKAAYRQLMDNEYLLPPLWLVRFARFEGDVVERAEEYRVLVGSNGKVFETTHVIPENRSGASLSLDDARTIAAKAVIARYQLDTAKLVPISETPSKLPARQNWEFVYSNPQDNPLNEGQARITVQIDGDEVTQAYKSVYIPEDWKRAERNRMNFLGILQSASGIVTIILFIAGLAISVLGWSRRRFSRPLFLKFFVVLFVLQAINSVNSWPSIVGHFSTSEPFRNQVLVTLGTSFLAALFISLNVALINGFIERWRRNQQQISGVIPVWLGLGAGVFASGLLTLSGRLLPEYGPLWPHFSSANAVSPIIGLCASAVGDYLKQGTLFLLLFAASDRFTNGWKTRRWVFLCILFFLGIAIAGSQSIESVSGWLTTGVVLAAAMIAGYIFVFRYYLCLVPLAVAGMMVLSLLRQAAYNAYPLALQGYIVAVVVILLVAFYWYHVLNNLESDKVEQNVTK